MKIGVSGASGKIGRAVVAGLQARAPGRETIAISRTPDMQASELHDSVHGRGGNSSLLTV